MLGILKKLFASGSNDRLMIEGYWCVSTVKLPRKVKTPLGSCISVVQVCVDIDFSVQDDNVVVHRVWLSHLGGTISGSSISMNVAAARVGEGWLTSNICTESLLVESVYKDLKRSDSQLQKMMIAKWRSQNRNSFTKSLADALNAHAPSEEIGRLLAINGRGHAIVFRYTKSKGESEIRRVTIEGVSGGSIRALDHKDNTLKSFRIDRISDARNA
jgi:hypothetical protein